MKIIDAREWPFSLTSTQAEVNLQGFERRFTDYLWGFTGYFEKPLGYETKENF